VDSAGLFRALIDYDQALWRRTWESIFSLPQELFTREVPYSHGSLRNQMVHVAATQARWLRGLRGDADARSFRPKPEDYPTRESARALWEGTSGELTAHVASMTDEDLEATARGMRGPAWHVLAHLVNHGTDHRAQVLRVLHDFGAPTFDQDLVMHLWSR
jgi:uncharacterized damage-inducible protein DinB